MFSMMKEYCRSLLMEGRYKFYCPDYTYSKKEYCNCEWEYLLVRHMACLSPDEMYEFEKKITNNYLMKARGQYRKCPGCQNWCFRTPGVRNNCVRCPVCTKTNGGAGFTFCWDCENKWRSSNCSGSCGTPDCAGKEGNSRSLPHVQQS